MLVRPSAVETALQSGRARVRKLVRFDLDGGSEGIWNETYDLVYEGCTYHGLGPNLEIGSIQSRTEMSSSAVPIVAPGCDSSVRAIIDGIDWHQRPAVVQIAFLDDAGDVIHIEPRMSGFLDHVSIEDAADQTCNVNMTIESNNRELSRSNGRLRSDSDQRQLDDAEDDTFFENVATSSVDDNILWGNNTGKAAKPKGLAGLLDKIF